MSQSGYAYIAAGENLAKDYSDDGAVLSAWMASEGHRANILNAAYQDIGIAHINCTLQGVAGDLVVAHYGARGPTPKPVKPVVAPKPTTVAVSTTSQLVVPTPATAAPPDSIVPRDASFGTKLWAITWRYILRRSYLSELPV